MNEQRTEQEIDELALMYEAATRFLTEVTYIKVDFYRQKFNPVLLIETKMAIRGLLSRYQKFGFFTGETVDVSLRKGKKENPLDIRFSPGLFQIISDVRKRALEEQAKELQKEGLDAQVV